MSLGGIHDGYGKANITPYIHAMVYHVPRLMRIHNGIRNFSGQGIPLCLLDIAIVKDFILSTSQK